MGGREIFRYSAYWINCVITTRGLSKILGRFKGVCEILPVVNQRSKSSNRDNVEIDPVVSLGHLLVMLSKQFGSSAIVSRIQQWSLVFSTVDLKFPNAFSSKDRACGPKRSNLPSSMERAMRSTMVNEFAEIVTERVTG